MRLTTAQRLTIIQRAGECCEYCRIKKTDETSGFQIDHIIPIKHHGDNDLENLCFSCFQCNNFKGSNMATVDPKTGKLSLLFDPRKQIWDDHFLINADATLTGKTSEGRVTIDIMRMNDTPRVQYRQFAASIKEYPCTKIS